MQPLAITEGDRSGKRPLVQANAGKRKLLVAALLQRSVTEGERAPAAGRLLSVTEVARLLGVCAATVYALCAKGALSHVRVLNAIRVAPGDLEAFVQARRSRGT